MTNTAAHCWCTAIAAASLIFWSQSQLGMRGCSSTGVSNGYWWPSNPECVFKKERRKIESHNNIAQTVLFMLLNQPVHFCNSKTEWLCPSLNSGWIYSIHNDSVCIFVLISSSPWNRGGTQTSTCICFLQRFKVCVSSLCPCSIFWVLMIMQYFVV